MARKLVSKGNERLPFAWRAIMCEGQDDVEEADRVAGRVEVRPARVDPAAVGLLRGEEIVDRTPDGGRESVLGQNAVATDQHEGREG